jgi:two-component system phosphate regulon response regulator PhoB
MVRILVLEDEARLCTAITVHLKSRGAEPIVATSVEEAINALDRLDFDLAVLDLKSEDGEGLEVLKYLRESSSRVDMPVIVLSAWDVEPASYNYLEPGDYLIKPFDVRMLDWMIRQLLQVAP